MKRKFTRILGVGLVLALLCSLLLTAGPVVAEEVDILNQTRLAAFSDTEGDDVVAEWNTDAYYIYSGDYSVYGVVPTDGDFFNIVHMDIGDGTPIPLSEITTIQFMEYMVSAGGTADLSAAVILFLNEPETAPPIEGVNPPWAGYEDAITFHNNGESATVGEWSVRDLADGAQNWEGYLDSDPDVNEDGIPDTVEPLSYWKTNLGDWEVTWVSIAVGAGDWAGYEGYIDNVMVDWTGGIDTYLTEPRIVNTTQSTGHNYIQDAIDTADPGDTINVVAGTYAEQVVIDKALTLQGAGETTVIQPSGPELTPTASIPWIGGGTGTMSAIVSVETTGGEVTIQNLEIDGSLITSKSTTWMGGLVYLETGGRIEGVTVNGGSTLPDRTAGIFAGAVTESVSLEIAGCIVEVYTRAGIYALGETLIANYHHNEINGPGSISTGVPNGMFFLEGVNGSATYNTVTDLGYTGVGEYRSTGIGTYNAGTDVTFAYNTISYVQNAFALSTDTIGTIVEYNNIFNNHTGVRIEAGASGSIIQYNDIRGNDFAMRCGPEMGDGNEAHYNSFVDNLGLEWENVGEGCIYIGAICNLHSTFALDATNNWWGHSSGPGGEGSGSGDTVSTMVDYEPWLLKVDGPAFNTTRSLPAGWSLISPDSAVVSTVVVGDVLMYEYTGEAFTTEISAPSPLKAIYVKTESGGGVGVNYAVVEPGVIYTRELVAGWNLISVPSTMATTQGILAQLRYAIFGTQQGVGLTTLISEGKYNQNTEGFIVPTLTDADWGELPALSPLDGYWAHLEADDLFVVIPD